jgi:hypothetical protein
MAIDQISVTLLGTAVIVALGVLFSNSRVGDIGSRLSGVNDRINSVQQNMTALIRAESGKLQTGMERIEGAIEAGSANLKRSSVFVRGLSCGAKCG